MFIYEKPEQQIPAESNRKVIIQGDTDKPERLQARAYIRKTSISTVPCQVKPFSQASGCELSQKGCQSVVQRQVIQKTKTKFNENEDEAIKQHVAANGENSWKTCILLGRTARQCKERWFNYLNPNINISEWTKEEDNLILQLVDREGMIWVTISKHFHNRRPESLMNRYLMIMHSRSTPPRRIPVHHRYNTRASEGATRVHPSFPRVDSGIYFTAIRGRPSFNSTVSAHFYAEPAQYLPSGIGLYQCRTSEGFQNLPRLGHATFAQKKEGAYCSIGHIRQWQDYVAANAEPDIITVDGHSCQAYKKVDVTALYNDINNLELQSQSYNSSIAFRYEESPLTPTWI